MIRFCWGDGDGAFERVFNIKKLAKQLLVVVAFGIFIGAAVTFLILCA